MEVEREIESEIIIGRLLGSEGYGKGYLGDGVQEEGKYFCDCCMSERNGVSEEQCIKRSVSHRSTTPLYGLCPEEYDSIIWAVSRKRAVQSVVTGVGTIFWRAGR